MNRPSFCYVVLAVAALAILMLTGGPADADYPGSDRGAVIPKWAKYSGTTISATNSVARTAGAAAIYTDAIQLSRCEQQSVMISATTSQSITLAPVVQLSIDGTNWSSEQTLSMAVTAAAPRKFQALNLPVAPYARISLAAHATYPVTYTAIVLNAW